MIILSIDVMRYMLNLAFENIKHIIESFVYVFSAYHIFTFYYLYSSFLILFIYVIILCLVFTFFVFSIKFIYSYYMPYNPSLYILLSSIVLI